MTKQMNFRINIIKRDGGETSGYIDMYGTLDSVKECAAWLNIQFEDKYLLLIGRCPVNDEIEDKLDQIIQLLKNRSKHE